MKRWLWVLLMLALVVPASGRTIVIDTILVSAGNVTGGTGGNLSDTNETVRVDAITSTNCTGAVVAGFYPNGTGYCEADDTGVGGGNPFDQSLNTTDQVTFSIINITGIPGDTDPTIQVPTTIFPTYATESGNTPEFFLLGSGASEATSGDTWNPGSLSFGKASFFNDTGGTQKIGVQYETVAGFYVGSIGTRLPLETYLYITGGDLKIQAGGVYNTPSETEEKGGTIVLTGGTFDNNTGTGVWSEGGISMKGSSLTFNYGLVPYDGLSGDGVTVDLEANYYALEDELGGSLYFEMDGDYPMFIGTNSTNSVWSLTQDAFTYLGGNVCTDTNGLCTSIDTNETTRVNAITSTNCTGQVVAGFYPNGTGFCEADDGGSGGDGTGGWTNTTLTTSTALVVNTSQNMYSYGDVRMNTLQTYFCDFLPVYSTSMCSPNFFGVVVGTAGISAASTGTAKMPGLVSISKGTTAGSGFAWGSGVASFLINGSETFAAQLSVVAPVVSNTTVVRLGFHDQTTVALAVAVTDGVYFQIVNQTVSGQVANASVRKTTSTNYTISYSTYYTYIIKIDSSASSANFLVKDEVGSLVYNQTITGGLPTYTGSNCGVNFIMGSTNVAAAAAIVGYLDYLYAEIGASRRPSI